MFGLNRWHLVKGLAAILCIVGVVSLVLIYFIPAPPSKIAMATSIISVITGIPIRRDVAMTGEVTLRGRALPIGGLKEKLLAALRAGITTVIIPKENEKDIAEVPDNVKAGLKIVPVATMGEVLQVALTRQPEAIDWVEPDVTTALPLADGDSDPVVTH